MRKKPFTVVAFELGTEYLKFVELTRDENRVIAAGIFPFAPGRGRDPGHLAAQIRSALDTTARGVPRGLIASAPLGEAWLRLIDLPEDAHGEAEIRDYATWDVSRYLGLSEEDARRDLAIDLLDGPGLPAPGDGPVTRRVIAAAMTRAAAETLRTAVEAATDLTLQALDVDVAALVNAFTVNYPEFAAARTVLIQANLDGVALARVHDGRFHGVARRPHDARALRGGETDAEGRVENLLHLARGVADLLRAGVDGWDAPEQLLLCGDLARDADFRDLLRAQLPLKFNLFNPFRNVPGPDPSEFPGAYPGAPLAAAVGLALRLAEDSR